MALRIGVLAVGLSLLSGCGSDDSTAKVGDDGGPPDDGPAVDFVTQDYELEPGDEKYICYTMNLPDRDVAIDKITPTYGKGTHHIFFAFTIAEEPEAVFDCPVLFKVTWIPLYLGGVDSGPLVLPDGAAFRMPPGQQIMVQLHLQNTTAEPIKDHVSMRLREAEPTDLLPAGVFGMDNRVIAVPPGSESVKSSMTCSPRRDMDVFAILGHMHKYGQRLDLFRTGAAGNEPLFSQVWNFDEQPTTPVSLQFAQSDELLLECSHGNPTSNPIGYGESSDNEMCAIVFYYTPYDELGGCVAQLPP
jgi:hypothetical protein